MKRRFRQLRRDLLRLISSIERRVMPECLAQKGKLCQSAQHRRVSFARVLSMERRVMPQCLAWRGEFCQSVQHGGESFARVFSPAVATQSMKTALLGKQDSVSVLIFFLKDKECSGKNHRGATYCGIYWINLSRAKKIKKYIFLPYSVKFRRHLRNTKLQIMNSPLQNCLQISKFPSGFQSRAKKPLFGILC